MTLFTRLLLRRNATKSWSSLTSANDYITISIYPPEEMSNTQAPQLPTPSASPSVTQIVGDRYLDFDLLNSYLEQTFGPKNFSLQVRQTPLSSPLFHRPTLF